MHYSYLEMYAKVKYYTVTHTIQTQPLSYIFSMKAVICSLFPKLFHHPGAQSAQHQHTSTVTDICLFPVPISSLSLAVCKRQMEIGYAVLNFRGWGKHRMYRTSMGAAQRQAFLGMVENTHGDDFPSQMLPSKTFPSYLTAYPLLLSYTKAGQ